jgi:hypothetical protein
MNVTGCNVSQKIGGSGKGFMVLESTLIFVCDLDINLDIKLATYESTCL